MKSLSKKLLNLFLLICLSINGLANGIEKKSRLIVLTDISYFEPDDAQSMSRLLLYSNQLDIEGLIATTNTAKRESVNPEIIRNLIREYEKVRPNLLKHEHGFPAAKKLLSMIKEGLPLYGMKGVGEGNDSEGSEWIIKMLEKKDDRPLWITIWGGSTVLAQTLWKINATKSESEAGRLIGKLRVFAISDQDDSGAWIRENFKNLFYIVSPGRYEDGTWSAIMKIIPGANNEVISNEWVSKNIQQGHGALGAYFPSTVFGLEGDTPSFLYLIPNGLNDPEHPNWGSWGGRYELKIPPYDPKIKWSIPIVPETRPIWTDAVDIYTPRVQGKWGRSLVKDTTTFSNNFVTLWRWREDFQNDFAARMAWCNTDYKHANHPPVVKLNSPERFTVKSDEIFNLDGSASYDPDGDAMDFFWFNYKEAGTCENEALVFPENVSSVRSKAPHVNKEQTIHYILKVTDKGTPRITRYKRVIVTVLPR